MSEASTPAPAPADVTIVTVTYGARWQLLRQCLAASRDEGVGGAIIVDNGASEDITALAAAEFGAFARVVRMERNRGSAGGFRAGLKAAQTDSRFILILDDDNRPDPGAIAALCRAWSAHRVDGFAPEALAVLAFRPGRQDDVAAGIPASGMMAEADAFFGLRLANLPFKILRRTRPGRRLLQRRRPPFVKVGIAPYSGLLFHASLLAKLGLPDENFLLYGDDSEFSYRITTSGGGIFLHPEARLTDLEACWGMGESFSSSFDGLLLGDSDFRAFYSTRNNAYFESRFPGRGSLTRPLNRALWLAILRWRAGRLGRMGRYRLLREAIVAGEAGRLGMSERFPLG